MKRLILGFALILITFCCVPAFGTHILAGSINYQQTTGNTVRARVILCTDLNSSASTDSVSIRWGDGTGGGLPRVNTIPLPGNLQMNFYEGEHAYAGPGSFSICAFAENRVGSLTNISGSISEAFGLHANVIISPFLGTNTSVEFLNQGKQRACINVPFYYDPVGYEADGDSVVYSLEPCVAANCSIIPQFQFPDVPGGGTMSIDPQTGLLSWTVPQLIGIYNVVIRATEYREGYPLGYTAMDVHIIVGNCNNTPPTVTAQDTCINVGTILRLPISASDSDGDGLTLQAFGSAFSGNPPPSIDILNSTGGQLNAELEWPITCDNVRVNPYSIVLQVTDDGDIPLIGYHTINVKLAAPAPENLTVLPTNSQFQLNWDASVCSNVSGYKIYRRIGSSGFVPSHCELGVPAFTGYTLIATLGGANVTDFIDSINVSAGNTYCYMIVAYFPDGAESYASEEVCADLLFTAPVLLNASVGLTDLAVGIDTVRWMLPIDLDTISFPEPYSITAHRIDQNGNATLIFTSPDVGFPSLLPTEYLDTSIPTSTTQHKYSVTVNSNGAVAGESASATTVFLNNLLIDNTAYLSWTEQVPWTNSAYVVERFDAGSWVALATVQTPSYADEDLTYGTNYCYRVMSIGSYQSGQVPSPLHNYSQETCVVPQDVVAPCTPPLTLDSDCESDYNELSWPVYDPSCAADVEFYFVWFSAVKDGPFELIQTIAVGSGNTFTHQPSENSITGCYYFTAMDSVTSFGGGNESLSGDTVCFEDCPVFTLPNVFTPNGDGLNDHYVSFPHRHIQSIDLKVYNRWGNDVFGTTDPDVNWNGTNKDSGELVTDGVYFYTCSVIWNSLEGPQTIELHGNIQVLDSTAPATHK
jgi:gliding motility-associated-like protein